MAVWAVVTAETACPAAALVTVVVTSGVVTDDVTVVLEPACRTLTWLRSYVIPPRVAVC